MSQRWVKIRNWIAVIGVLVASLGLVVLTQGKPVQAADMSTIALKSKMYALSQCYTNNFVSPIYTRGNSWYGDLSLIALDTEHFVFDAGADFKFEGMYQGCVSIVSSSGNIPSASAPATEVSTFLENIGYNLNRNLGADKACVYFAFTHSSKGTSTAAMCVPTTTGDANGEITAQKVTVDWHGDKAIQFEIGKNYVTPDCKTGGLGKDGCNKVEFGSNKNIKTLRALAIALQSEINGAQAKHNGALQNGWRLASLDFGSGADEDREYTKGVSPDKAIAYFSNNKYKSTSQLMLTDSEMADYLYNTLTHPSSNILYFSSKEAACQKGITEENRELALQTGHTRVALTKSLTCYIKPADAYRSTPAYTAAGQSHRNYLNGTLFDYDTVFSELNRLNGLQDEEIIEDPKKACEDKFNSTLTAIENLLKDSHIDTAYRKKLNAAKEKILNIFDTYGQYWYEKNGMIVCYDVPDIGPPSDDDDDPGTTPPPGADEPGNSPDPASGGSDITQCLNQAGSLGWILCPVLSIVKTAAESFYSSIADDWLPIEANLVSNNSGIYEGWKIFRNMANIIFVVMLMIILFSQITGAGVSNYGIKKMLPSLIVVAVLVNVSFVICQLAVDITNIVGAEIGSILENIGSINTPDGATQATGATVLKGAIGMIFSAAGVGVAAYTVALNPGILILVLISGIGILISLFFFFAILALRKAAVYICIMAAPLAIIFYALPNTKSIYDRWKKLFMATLIVYPICQAITGAGQMISQLMLGDQNDGFIYSVVAVILSFAPIFFIPSIVSNSLAGLGNLGARVSQLGRRASTGLTRIARNADLTKRAQIAAGMLGATRGQELVGRINNRLRNMRGVGRVVRGIENSRPGKAINALNTRRAAERMQAYRKMRLGDGEARYIAEHMNIENDLAAQEQRQQDELISNTIDGVRSGNHELLYENDQGVLKAANGNDFQQLGKALEYYQDLYERTKSEDAKLNMQALTSMMFNAGDTSRSIAINAMKKHNYDQTSGIAKGAVNPNTGKVGNTDAFSTLSKYINRNDKWMGALKPADRGSFDMIGAGARGETNNLHHFNTSGANSIISTGAGIHGLGDSFYDGLGQAEFAGSYGVPGSNNPTDTQAAQNLLSAFRAFNTATANANTMSGLTEKDIVNMNKVGRLVYMYYRKEWDTVYDGKGRDIDNTYILGVTSKAKYNPTT